MSEPVLSDVKSDSPKAVYLKNYTVPSYLIDEINLEFDLNQPETTVTASLRVRRNRQCQQKLTALTLHGESLSLESIHLNDQRLLPSQFEVTKHHLIIADVPDVFLLRIVTKITPDTNTALSGLYQSGSTYCTQCEAEGFRRITYFLDQPDILSRYTTTVIADEQQYPILLSNGNLVESGKLEHDRHWAKWEDPFKKPSYLFALVAGDFDLLEDQYVTQSNRVVSIKIYVEKGNLSQAHHAMYAVKKAMRWDEEAYGREYDLDIYMIVAIGDFNMGAMENKGLNIFNTKYVLAKPETATDDDYMHIMSVVAHEYFHNWTGNRVTCRDWFQLSLKEGLTIYRDQSFSEDTISHAVMRIRDVNRLREVQFPEDAGPLAHPVRPESYLEIDNFYTATVYEKGAEILRMLSTILGGAMFRKGMDLYFARYDGQAVTIEDLLNVMSDVSGVDLTQFHRWYSQVGTPVVAVKSEYDERSNAYCLHMTQQSPPMHIPIRMGLLNQAGECLSGTDTVLSLTAVEQTFRFEGISAKPVPSLLRNFSAPIKLHYDYTDDELIFLVNHDQDAFNRWEASQRYFMRVLLGLVADYQAGKKLVLTQQALDLFAFFLQDNINDKFFLSELLRLPSEKYMAEQMDVIQVEAIHVAREFMLTQIATQHEAAFLALYQRYHQPSVAYEFNIQAVGHRQLKNACLAYLARISAQSDLLMQQFKQSLTSNMTDTQAALQEIVQLDLPLRDEVLSQFYTAWQGDALVVDKWLAIQATSQLPGALQNVKQLMKHPAFELHNPNKVYALIGAFSHRNALHFHAADGEGYVFLRQCVDQLDKLNPQVAARMVNALTTWRRYDKDRQRLMQSQLKQLLENKNISTNLYEQVTKSLSEV